MLELDLDLTYLLVLALFLLPLLILNGLVFGPFLRVFAERHDKLEGALVRAENMLEQSEAKARSFEEKIQVATARGLEARNKIRNEAAGEMNARIEAERVKITSRLEGAMQELKSKRMEALADATVEANRLAELTAAKLLGRGV